MHQCTTDVIFYGCDGNAKPACDLTIGQLIDPVQQEDFAGARRERRNRVTVSAHQIVRLKRLLLEGFDMGQRRFVQWDEI